MATYDGTAIATTIAVITARTNASTDVIAPPSTLVEGHETPDRRRPSRKCHPNEGAKSTTTEPSARNGPNGMPIVLPARP